MKHAVRNALRRPWRLIRRHIGPHTPPQEARGLADALYQYSRDPVVLIDIAAATNAYFYTFGPRGWSPFQGAASVLLGGGSREDVRSYLSAFYSRFQPRNLAEASFGMDVELPPLSALTPFESFKPWRDSIRRISGHDGSGNQNFGPVSAKRLEVETDRIVETFRSVQRHGYRPEAFVDGFIRGYALADGTKLAFVITSGVHRAAVLSALGDSEVRAKFNPRMPRVIEKGSLPLWPHIRSGFCSPEAASEIFDRHIERRPDARRPAGPG